VNAKLNLENDVESVL